MVSSVAIFWSPTKTESSRSHQPTRSSFNPGEIQSNACLSGFFLVIFPLPALPKSLFLTYSWLLKKKEPVMK